MQITNTNKIFININDSSYLASITNIDSGNPNFTLKEINLSRNNYIGTCNFNQSYFYTPSIDFEYSFNCSTNSIDFKGRDTFNANNHNWIIKKTGKSVEGTYQFKNITHTFQDTGNYLIKYIASKDNRADTIIKTIEIYPKIKKDFLGRDTAYEIGTNFNRTLQAPINMQCYYWSNNNSTQNTFTTDTIGKFICKLTSKSYCMLLDTISISNCVNDMQEPTIIRSGDKLYVNHLLADSFIWFRNGEVFKITKEKILHLTDTGSYMVEAAKKGHCSKFSNLNLIKKLNKISQKLIEGNINIFPNPVNNQLTIDFEIPDNYQITLYNSIGQTIQKLDINSTIVFNIGGLPSGLYLIKITNSKNQLFENIIIKD